MGTDFYDSNWFESDLVPKVVELYTDVFGTASYRFGVCQDGATLVVLKNFAGFKVA